MNYIKRVILFGNAKISANDIIEAARRRKPLSTSDGKPKVVAKNVKKGRDIFDEDEPEEVPEHLSDASALKMNGHSYPTYTCDIPIYAEDRITEIRNKLYLATNIPPFRQHLFWSLGAPVHFYKITTDKFVRPDILNDSNPQHFGIPIDRDIYDNRKLLKIRAYDYFITMQMIIARMHAEGTNQVPMFYLLDLEDFMTERAQIDQISRTDPHQFELIYYGFIAKYYPWLSSPNVFREYIHGGDKHIASTYPRLSPSPAKLNSFIELEKSMASELITNHLKGPYDIKYWSNPENYYYSLTFAIIQVRSERKYDIKDLFNRLTVGQVETKGVNNPSINILKLNTEGMQVTKVSRYMPTTDDSIALYRKLSFENSLQIICTVAGLTVSIIVFPHGMYELSIDWSDKLNMGFTKANRFIEKHIVPLVEGLGTLAPIRMAALKYKTLNMSLVWRHPITHAAFEQLEQIMTKWKQIGVINSSETINAYQQNYYFNKGIIQYDLNRLEYFMSVDNYYDYLTVQKVAQKWAYLYERGRKFNVINRSSFVRVDIFNIREDEFIIFNKYITSIFRQLAMVKVPKTAESDATKRLAKLKESDPILYDFRKYNSRIIYSKLCQKKYQPDVYSEEEYEQLPKAIKAKAVEYKNFTTDRPAYYVCPNPKCPNLSFIAGKHPLNYCLPCCKMMLTSQEGTKKHDVYTQCLTNYTYHAKPKSSRYIINYGKTVEVGRLSRLPLALYKFINDGVPNFDIDAIGNIKVPNLFMCGIEQDLTSAIQRKSWGGLMVLADILQIPPEQILTEVVDYMLANPSLFVSLQEGRLPDHFASLETLVNQFTSPLYDLTWTNWNELIIEAVSIQRGLYSIIIWDHTQTTIGTNIKHVSEHIDVSVHIYGVPAYDRPNACIIYKKRTAFFPVYEVIPREFFSNLTVKNRIHMYTSVPIQNLAKSIKRTEMTTDVPPVSPEILMQYAPDIQFCLNQSNVVHAAYFKDKKTDDRIYFPIAYTPRLDTYPICPDVVVMRSSSWNFLELFIRGLNMFIDQLSEARQSYVLEKRQGELVRVLRPVVAKIAPVKKITLDESGTQVVGFVSNDLHYYFEPTSVDPFPNLPFTVLAYDPSVVNLAIVRGSSSGKFAKMYEQAMGKRYAYNLYVMNFLKVVQRTPNKKMRAIIEDIILHNSRDKVKKKLNQLDISHADLVKLNSQFEAYYLGKETKEAPLGYLRDSTYDFDRQFLKKIFSLSRENLEEVIAKVEQKFVDKGIDTSFRPILVADIMNPLKRDILEQLARIHRVSYKVSPYEMLYIS